MYINKAIRGYIQPCHLFTPATLLYSCVSPQLGEAVKMLVNGEVSKRRSWTKVSIGTLKKRPLDGGSCISKPDTKYMLDCASFCVEEQVHLPCVPFSHCSGSCLTHKLADTAQVFLLTWLSSPGRSKDFLTSSGRQPLKGCEAGLAWMCRKHNHRQ